MLIFLKNLLSDVWERIDYLFPFWYQKCALVALAVVITILMFGCSPAKMVAPAIEGPGYCEWKGAPSWLAKDVISDARIFGVIDGYEFDGKHGLPCYALKMDAPPADGSCDAVVVICETGNTDGRWGPGTPLVVGVSKMPCSAWDGLLNAIKQDEANKNI